MHTMIFKRSKTQNVFATLTLGFLLLVALTSCVSTSNVGGPTPLWVTDPMAVYADSKYLSAVGYAPDRPSAEADAVASLSKTIRQRVEANSSATQSFDSDSEGVDREFTATVQTSSIIEEIAGIKIQEVWTAKDDTVYTLASINREEVGRYYSRKIRDFEAGISGFIAFTADNPASFEGLDALEKALALAYENELHLDLLAVINPMSYKTATLAYQSAQTIEVLIQHEKEKINIGVSVANDVNGRITAALAAVLKKTGFKTQILPEDVSVNGIASEDAPDMPYVLAANLSVEPFQMSSTSENRYVRFVLNTELVDIRTNKVLLPWAINGREAHFSNEEAIQRAIRTIEQEIEKNYLQEALKITN